MKELRFGIYTDLYNSVINDLESGEFYKNIKAIRKQISDLKESIRVFVKGSAFCQDPKMLKKTELRIQLQKDKLRAMNASLAYIEKEYWKK